MATQTVVFQREGRSPITVTVNDTDGNLNNLSPQEIEDARRQALQSLPAGSNMDLFTMVMAGPQVTQVAIPEGGTAAHSHYGVRRLESLYRPGILPDETPRPFAIGEFTADAAIPAGAVLLVRVDNQLLQTQALTAGATTLINLPPAIADGNHAVSLEVVEPGGNRVFQFTRSILVSSPGEPGGPMAPAPLMISEARVVNPNNARSLVFINDPIAVDLTSNQEADVVFRLAGREFNVHVRPGTQTYTLVGPREARDLTTGVWQGQIEMVLPEPNAASHNTIPLDPVITIQNRNTHPRSSVRRPPRL